MDNANSMYVALFMQCYIINYNLKIKINERISICRC